MLRWFKWLLAVGKGKYTTQSCYFLWATFIIAQQQIMAKCSNYLFYVNSTFKIQFSFCDINIIPSHYSPGWCVDLDGQTFWCSFLLPGSNRGNSNKTNAQRCPYSQLGFPSSGATLIEMMRIKRCVNHGPGSQELSIKPNYIS